MPSMVGHTSNPSNWEAEEREHEFEVSLNYIASLTQPWLRSKII